MKFSNILLLTAISGLLTQLSLAPGHIFFLAFFALTPFFYLLSKSDSLKERFFIGLLTGFFANVFGFYWMILVFKNFFLYSMHESIFLFFLYCFIGHSQFMLFSIAFHLMTKKLKQIWSLSFVLLVASSYSVIDYLTPKLFGDTLGNAFDSQPYLREFAANLGIAFLTFICAFSNAAITSDFIKRQKKNTYFFASFLIICLILGAYLNKQKVELIASANKFLNVATIQPNITGVEKLKVEKEEINSKERTFSKLKKLSEVAIQNNPKLDLIIWPETAYPAFYTNPFNSTDESINSALKQFVLIHHVPILLGLTDRDESGNTFNSALLIQEDQGLIKTEIYHKVVLAFMGEYNPFAKKTNSTLSHGDVPTLLNLKTKNFGTIKISPIICYESMSPLYVSKANKLNPDIIVHITNEAWFGYFGLPYSFLYLSAFRAIETSKPMIKAANAGFSALILPDGTVTNRSKLNDEEVIQLRVPLVTK
jgi:apolipoprotein N-acyltransferase